jgi:D-alanyl-D-alanine carboxypeptidase (penicillin-binding protein 5/6)
MNRSMILKGGRRAASAYLGTWRRFNKNHPPDTCHPPDDAQGPDMKDAQDAPATPPSATAKRKKAVIRCLAWMALLLGAYGPAAQGQTAPPKAVREGDTGQAVEALQRALNAKLDPSPGLSIDGDFGQGTRAALVRFQRAKGLTVTGVADAKTLEALGPVAKAEPAVPPPAVVNAEKRVKRPAEPLLAPPFVTAKAWAIADGKTGETLWGKDEAKPLDMASTTKIMTALVVVRLAAKDPSALDEVVTFSKRADDTPGSTSGVRAGERVPVGELMYGLLLPSGNDASVAFGEHFGGRLPKVEGSTGDDPLPRFIAEMNRVAAAEGLKETHFANPNGLPAPGHHSSARDLARLAKLALANPTFADCVSTRRRGCTLVDAEGRKRDLVWTNTNHLLEIEGYDGVKTGTTTAAGACLVASGHRGDDWLIVVILGADSAEGRYVDAKNLFRWAWLKRGHREN